MSSGPPPPTQGRPVYLIGGPVDHSLSPVIHNAAFRAQDLDLEYVAWRVKRGGVEDALSRLHESDAAGANVTVPHKQVVHGLLADLSETAAATGAVNTLVRKPGGWRGDNTDVQGFLAPLREITLDSEGGTALVLGAGGAARAVVVGLLRECAFGHIVVAARRIEQAESLCELFRTTVASHGHATLHSRPIDTILDIPDLFSPTLVVNATPVGMHPNEDDCPLPDTFDFHGVELAYDLIYNPPGVRAKHLSPFLRRARRAGTQTINGLPMLIAQAAASFRLWTGREMDVEAVQSALADSSS